MNDSELSGFALAGGTALALYMGHRLSIDLDLFTTKSFDAARLEKYLVDKYNFMGDYLEKDTLKGSIDGVKLDCITFDYPSIDKLHIEDGIRLYSIRDIAAMKLSAIADNGTRLKDFIDVAYLSTKMPLSDMINAYKQKFPNANAMRPLKGLNFFNDIDHKEHIQMIDSNFNWKIIEKRLRDMVSNPKKVFVNSPLPIKKKGMSL